MKVWKNLMDEFLYIDYYVTKKKRISVFESTNDIHDDVYLVCWQYRYLIWMCK